MALKAKSEVVMRDFPGLILNMDPTDLPLGAGREQVNCNSAKVAALEVRQGYRPVQFEDDDE